MARCATPVMCGVLGLHELGTQQCHMRPIVKCGSAAPNEWSMTPHTTQMLFSFYAMVLIIRDL